MSEVAPTHRLITGGGQARRSTLARRTTLQKGEFEIFQNCDLPLPKRASCREAQVVVDLQRFCLVLAGNVRLRGALHRGCGRRGCLILPMPSKPAKNPPKTAMGPPLVVGHGILVLPPLEGCPRGSLSGGDCPRWCAEGARLANSPWAGGPGGPVVGVSCVFVGGWVWVCVCVCVCVCECIH